MKPSINTKELCKQIRFCGKHGAVIWIRDEKQHIITNRHFMVRFDELPRDILAALFSVFYKLPEIGDTFAAHLGQMNEPSKPINYEKLYQPDLIDTAGVVTEYLRDFGNGFFARLLKFPNHYSFVNVDYFKLFSGESIPATRGNTPDQPIYFVNGDLLILPYRFKDSKLEIEDLLGAE